MTIPFSPEPDDLAELAADEAMVPAPAGSLPTETGFLRATLRVFAENRLAVVSLAFLVFMVLFCFLGPLVYDSNQTNAQQALLHSTQNAPPGSGHPLGTDDSGFDVLGRIMYGGRISLVVGFASALVSTLVGVIYGSVSGFFGGWVDSAMMRLVDVGLSIPLLFLLIALATIYQPTAAMLIIVIAVVSWFVPARLIRAETLTLKSRDYVSAVRSMGGSRPRMIGRHIVPNSIGTIVVFATFNVADSILLLASLGFLGLGVPAPQTDWGSMLSNGVNYASSGYWWQIYPVGVAIVLVVVALNYLGDALRDAFEVRLQRR